MSVFILHTQRITLTVFFRTVISVLFLFALFFASITPSIAAESGWLQDNTNRYAKARITTGQIEKNSMTALLEIQLAPGWKTYWRSPGEGGVPLEIDLNEPDLSSQIFWPVPETFEIEGIYIQAYNGNISIPLTLTTTSTFPDVITGTLMLSTCSNICMLTPYEFSLDLRSATDEYFDYSYQFAMDSVPSQTEMIQEATASYQNNQLTITVIGTSPWRHPAIYLDTLTFGSFLAPIIDTEGSKFTAHFPIRSHNVSNDLKQQTISFVIADGNHAQEVQTILNSSTQNSPDIALSLSLFQTVIFAFLGGLILNLMPCVLPVLGLKLGQILHADKKNKSLLRQQFFASSAGILTSFWLLALLMSSLRFAGVSLSWGIQFQNPYFIGFMVIITAVFSLNLLGLLGFYLPGSWNNYLATRGNENLRGHFLQGMLATLLATPCSAPFLGTALAIALVAPLPQLWLIFTFLGLGMSLPWLIIALIPRLALFLPKPGRWMLVVRVLLGLMMLASCVWLLKLLANYIGETATIISLAIFALTIGIAIAKQYGVKIFGYTVLGCCLVFGVCVLFGSTILKSVNYVTRDQIKWQPLTEEAIEQALAENKRVFVDVMADWCLTCRMNTINVIMREDIQRLLSEPDVVPLRGNWTKPTEVITQFLKRRGQFAVPYNQVYGPGLPHGEALSPILTTHDVKTLMQKAKG